MKRPRVWRNSSGSVQVQPLHRSMPVTLEEIQAAVLRCAEDGERLRVAGGGHSLTPLCWTDENLMSLDRYTGIARTDLESRRVWVRAGTRLWKLGDKLAERGLALQSFGDTDTQTIAGAISAGAHGSGAGISTLATQVTRVALVCADGSSREISSEVNAEMFDAARLSLGALGVITHVQLQCVDAYRLQVSHASSRLDQTLSRLTAYRRNHQHFEFRWHPYSEVTQLRFMDTTQATLPLWRPLQRARTQLLDRTTGRMMSALSQRAPRAYQRLSRISAGHHAKLADIVDAHEAYISPPRLAGQDLEYGLPLAALPQVLAEMDLLLRRLRPRLAAPVQVRFAAADPLWLSPAYQRETAYVRLQLPQDATGQQSLSGVIEIFARHQGRPHWGKLHNLYAEELRRLYPRFDEFRALRESLDPRGVFLNPYLSGIFGVRQR